MPSNDISLKILLFLNSLYVYDNTDVNDTSYQNIKLKITFSALKKLTKFINIFIKTVFLNSCMLVLHKGKSKFSYEVMYIYSMMIEGYKINIPTFKNDSKTINYDSSIYKYTNKRKYTYSGIFEITVNSMLMEIVSIYGEGKINKRDVNDINNICQIINNLLFLVVDTQVDVKNCDKSKEYIITDKTLDELSNNEYIIKMDNSLGGYGLLKYDNLNFNNDEFKEINIDDIIDIDIENEIDKIEKDKLIYKSYVPVLSELVVD